MDGRARDRHAMAAPAKVAKMATATTVGNRATAALAAALAILATLAAGGMARAAEAKAGTAPDTKPDTGAKHTAAPRIEQREPTAEERESFAAFFSAINAAQPQRPWGAAPLFAPAFDIERQRGKPWRVIARVDSAPRRSAPDLCRQIRSSFIYDATKPKGQRWTDAAEAPRWYVWLAQPNVPCQPARYTVLADPAVPWGDAAALLRQHRELLIRARLLFAGNSGCARQRALTFRLAALEPAAATPGAPAMFGMVFESDRDTKATVAVRKHRGEYVAWNVSCSG